MSSVQTTIDIDKLPAKFSVKSVAKVLKKKENKLVSYFLQISLRTIRRIICYLHMITRKNSQKFIIKKSCKKSEATRTSLTLQILMCSVIKHKKIK